MQIYFPWQQDLVHAYYLLNIYLKCSVRFLAMVSELILSSSVDFSFVVSLCKRKSQSSLWVSLSSAHWTWSSCELVFASSLCHCTAACSVCWMFFNPCFIFFLCCIWSQKLSSLRMDQPRSPLQNFGKLHDTDLVSVRLCSLHFKVSEAGNQSSLTTNCKEDWKCSFCDH